MATVKIALVNDTHVGASGSPVTNESPDRIAVTRSQLESVIADINSWGPDRFIHQGDIRHNFTTPDVTQGTTNWYGGGYDPQIAACEDGAALSALRRVEATQILTPGNHDVWDTATLTQWQRIYGQSGSGYYRVGHVGIVLMLTQLIVPTGGYDGTEQSDYINTTLPGYFAQAKADFDAGTTKLVICVGHHDLKSERGATFASTFYDMMLDAHVTLFFHGHLHKNTDGYMDAPYDSIRKVQAAGTAYNLTSGYTYDDLNWVKLTVDDDGSPTVELAPYDTADTVAPETSTYEDLILAANPNYYNRLGSLTDAPVVASAAGSFANPGLHALTDSLVHWPTDHAMQFSHGGATNYDQELDCGDQMILPTPDEVRFGVNSTVNNKRAWSVELWYQGNGYISGSFLDLFAQGIGAGVTNAPLRWFVRTDLTNLNLWNGVTVVSSVDIGVKINDGVRRHFVLTYDPDADPDTGEAQMKMYVDGVLKGTANNITWDAPAGNTSIGRRFDAGIAGSLDEVAIYPYALDLETIEAHFDKGQYYDLTVNNGTGSTAQGVPGYPMPIAANDPDPGYFDFEWTGDDAGYVADVLDPTTTLTMPTADAEITATYTQILYTILQYPRPSAISGVLSDGNGRRWDDAIGHFVDHVDADWDGYVLAAAQVGTTAYYQWDVSNLNSLTSGVGYVLHIYDSATPAISDMPIASIAFDWTGGSISNTRVITHSPNPLDNITARLSHLGVGTVYNSPMESDQHLVVVQGDDVALEWDSDLWDNLTSATIRLKLRRKGNPDVTVEYDGSVTVAGDSTQTVAASITAAQSALLTTGVGAYDFRLYATLSGGEVKTLQLGTVDVKAG